VFVIVQITFWPRPSVTVRAAGVPPVVAPPVQTQSDAVQPSVGPDSESR